MYASKTVEAADEIDQMMIPDEISNEASCVRSSHKVQCTWKLELKLSKASSVFMVTFATT